MDEKYAPEMVEKIKRIAAGPHKEAPKERKAFLAWLRSLRATPPTSRSA